MVSIPKEKGNRIKQKLEILYGNSAGKTFKNLEEILVEFEDKLKKISTLDQNDFSKPDKFTKNDIILNCYADSIQSNDKYPLEVLKDFSANYFKSLFNGIHVLPFYKWDTDRGFSVVNYYEVDSKNGTWDQFSSLKDIYEVLMVDCVLNHASIDNPLVQKSLIEDLNYVITFNHENKPSEVELKKITRARPYPILTQYYVIRWMSQVKAVFNLPKHAEIIKTGWVWTTFSRANNKDGLVETRQVDLNYTNPDMLLEIIKLIFYYIEKGANWIRLDAVGYLWKKIGTSCLHLPETHLIIELLAEILSLLKEKIVLISEVNEPQENALQYLGSKENKKSDMIYLFTHYPLAVHAVLTGTGKYYSEWLPSLYDVCGRLFVSVLGTHDGMGMKPIGNWLPEDEKEKLQKIILESHGGLPNYAKLPGGKNIVYELCATPWSFINSEESQESLNVQINRYMVVFSLGLTLKGVPSIYINGLLGIPNFKGPLDENRSINRQILNKKELTRKLSDQTTKESLIFQKLMKLINIRRNESAFDFNGSFKVFNLNECVVSVILTSSDSKKELLSLINVSNSVQIVKFENKIFKKFSTSLTDRITGISYDIKEHQKFFKIKLLPYQICWLT